MTAKKVRIKPLSVNDAWKGRRYKTPEYKQYEWDMLIILPKLTIPDGLLELHLVFGFSSASSDFDNPIKPFVDCAQKKYGFNDKRIKRSITEVCQVKKGKEFIFFEFKPYTKSSFLDEIKNL